MFGFVGGLSEFMNIMHKLGEENEDLAMSKLWFFGPKKAALPKTQERKFLDSHPAKQLGLPENLDKNKFGHTSFQAKEVATSSLSTNKEAILLNYGCAMSNKESNWTDKKKEDARSFIEHQSRNNGPQSIEQKKRGLHSVMEQLYMCLRRMQFHYNTVTAGTDLYVTDTMLDDVTETLQVNRFGEVELSVHYLRARFSTNPISLVLRGRGDVIEFFLIPAAHAMSLSKIESESTPLLMVQVRVLAGRTSWRIVDEEPNVNELDDLAMWLFDRLIDATKAAINEQFELEERRFYPDGDDDVLELLFENNSYSRAAFA